MNVNLEYYRIFYYTGKYKNITMTAKALCISQPAVSQAIKQLEKQAGQKLFTRSRKGVELTVEGEMLYSYISRGYECILQGEKKLAELANLESGELRIGASDMTLKFYLLPYLEVFHRKYPGIKISVTNGPTPETLKHLKSGKIDFAVVSEPFEVDKDERIINVKKIEDVFIIGSRFNNLNDTTFHINEINKYPLIFLEKNTSTRRYVDKYLSDNKAEAIPEFELATSDMIVQFATRNLGIGCVVRNFAEEAVKAGTLSILNIDKPVPPRHICLVTSEDIPLSNAAVRMVEILKDNQQL